MRKQFTFAIAAMLVLASCSEKQTNEPIDNPEGAINFSSELSVDTKGTPIEGDRMTRDFGVYAYRHHGSESQENLCPDLMFNQHIYVNGGSCSYNPLKYWQASGQVNFFAYSPYKNNPYLTYPKKDTDNGWPYHEYTVEDNVGNQEDLMFAKSMGKCRDDKPVHIKFHHALAKVGVYAYLAEECKDMNVKVTKVEFKNIKSKGIFYFKNFEENNKEEWWKCNEGHLKNYVLGLADYNGVTVKYSNVDQDFTCHTQLNANNMFLLAMPQTLDECAELYLEYEIIVKKSDGKHGWNEEVEKCNVTIPIYKHDNKVIKWRPCEFMAYDIKITLEGCEIDACLCEWEARELDYEICY